MQARYHFGLLMLGLTCGAFSVGACGDDGGTTTNSSAGTGQTDGGSAGTSSAGNGHAGSVTSGGVGVAGTSSGGKKGTGGAACEIQECFRANVCLDKCGGKVVSSGCCACSAPTVDELSCAGGAGGQGSTSSDCVGMTCGANQTCVAYRTVGGVQLPPDAGGGCMTGRHVENDHCVSDFAYTCAALSGCSAPATTCHCAAGSKCSNANACRLPFEAAWLDADADLVCEQQVP